MTAPRPLRDFLEAICALPPRLSVDDACCEALRLFRDDRLSIYYALFDYVNNDARIAVVGVTPGPTQIVESLGVVRDTLNAGGSEEEALRRVKQRASFRG